jgi:hypothetical protein
MFAVVKSYPNFWATCVIFKKKLPKENNRPAVENSAQSGHPASKAFACNMQSGRSSLKLGCQIFLGT